jgi:tRNA modification GTPase
VIHAPDDPIFALATAPASSALAVIRVSGIGSLRRISGMTRGKPLEGLAGHTLHRRVIRDGDENVDEVLISVFRAPSSFTGEEGAEISCHGGLPVIRRLLSALSRAGFRPAGPGEFTQRAFLNGRIDLTRAEAVNEIVRARTDRARALALDRLSGAIQRRILEARDALVGVRASLEVMIDYPDDEVQGDALDAPALDHAEALLRGLFSTYRRGRIFQEGVSVALAGATNAGKSSLFNALLRQDRAIVSEIHGTTRDWLEAGLSMCGVPVRLFDTAGLRGAADPLELEAMKRSAEVLRAADAVMYLVDGTVGVAADDAAFMAGWAGPAPLIPVWNKQDLPSCAAAPDGYVGLSAATGAGLDALEQAVARAVLGSASTERGEPLIDSERQRDLVGRTLEALARFRAGRARAAAPDLLAVDLADALSALGEITGEVTSAEVLERMFAGFCVGK